MSIVHEGIVNKHDGSIDVQSERGKGTDIVVRISLASRDTDHIDQIVTETLSEWMP